MVNPDRTFRRMTFKCQVIALNLEVVGSDDQAAVDARDGDLVIASCCYAFNVIVNDLPALALHLNSPFTGSHSDDWWFGGMTFTRRSC